ncbi:cation:proton antiporter regulatory subunit [Saccharibacillus brassicae]|uniref:Cation:proton antiporter regulatory subunit n=1 Tax=Saccharibacillus brassicae TaxID=2583377 RepID=A0A4Y6USN3_SACBS|nr:cation:proton antiporter regulatory subunit [Saccharibacillus brassicae]QDH20064.1 cation:proton antiporter regulatory subunit [Saccharibacillus brassicae]
MSVIRETDLPGIGRKFLIDTEEGDRFIVILHEDGKRELFCPSPEDPEELMSVMTLTDTEARQLGGIVGGMNYQPTALEKVEHTLDQLSIEWYKLKKGMKAIGRSIGDLKIRENTGTIVIAAIETSHKQTVSPGPEYVLAEGMTLVVAGERQNIQTLKRMLEAGEA